MFLSKRPSNSIYYLWYQDDLGHKRAVSTHCKLKSDALKFLQTFRPAHYKPRQKIVRLSINQFADQYYAYSQTIHTPNTHNGVKLAFKQFVSIAGDLPMHRVGIREIDYFLSKKREEASEWTARNYYIILSSAFETAKRWNVIDENPFRKVVRPKMKELLPLYFTREKFEEFIKKVDDPDDRELYYCAVMTGLRQSELTALQWRDVDFDRHLILVQNSEVNTTKSKRNRSVPMHPLLYQLLLERKQKSVCIFVFHDESGQRLTKDEVSKTFKKSVGMADVAQKLHFHSLRHTFATWLVQASVSIYEVQKLLGHASISTTMIYAHLAPSELGGAVSKISMELPSGSIEPD